MVQLSRLVSVRWKDALGNLEGESGLPNAAQKATDHSFEVSEQLRLRRRRISIQNQLRPFVHWGDKAIVGIGV
ncbi:hypothetical protein CEP54_000300 [Fusarium duplospermum]|uniref:Uncharacterized protein n=1 Tax=Fusarium duplospermum TaxID=1325734 RepID=A0A428R6N3_9HYPO|nr:hypothetical protein CEP54_000300 [Fusarium duplospermum]